MSRSDLVLSVRIALCLLVAPLAMSLAPKEASAGAGDLLWEDRYDLGLGLMNFVFAVEASQGKVFTAGAGPFRVSPGSNADILVRSYDARTGVIEWMNRW